MKIIHLSDLHIGKRVYEYSMIEDQRFILERIAAVIGEESPDCVIIAGDVYDKTVPPAEAVELFDDFLVRISGLVNDIFVISGNHDSAERIAFGRSFMDKSGIHISPVYKGRVEPYIMNDAHGETAVYLLPFVKPSTVRPYVDDAIGSYTDAVRAAVKQMNVDKSRRNVLVAHQFVTGGKRSESEEISVGGMDNVDASVFADFDYVALGHLHRPQRVGDDRIRYCGTPLKYSFSEMNDLKSVTVAELGEKGSLEIREIPLVALHNIVEVRGSFEQLMDKSFYSDTTYRSDYTHIVLTDENDVPDAESSLRVVYRRIMKIDYDNTRTRMTTADTLPDPEAHLKDPLSMFAEFFRLRNGRDMTEEQTDYVKGFIGKIWDGEKEEKDDAAD